MSLSLSVLSQVCSFLIFIMAVFDFVIGHGVSPVLAQEIPRKPTTVAPSGSSSKPESPKVDTQGSGQAESFKGNRTSDRQNDLENLSRELSSLKRLVYFALGGLGVLVSALTLLSIVLNLRADRREQDVHTRLISGEDASQERAAKIHGALFQNSVDIVTLVKDTLDLATGAMRKASEVVHSQALQSINALEHQAKRIIDTVEEDAPQVLVENPTIRRELRSIAEKVTGFEYMQYGLSEKIEIPSHCRFAQGLFLHLGQRHIEAIEKWEQAANRASASFHVATLARYWIGYEQNNIMNFADAIGNFQIARTVANPARLFEIDRIILETRFFAEDPMDALIPQYKSLMETYAEGGGQSHIAHRGRLAFTLGNMFYSAGLRAKQARGQESSERAKDNYELAFEAFKQGGDLLWARFGRAQADFRLNELYTVAGVGAERTEYRELFEAVRNDAGRQIHHREEARSRFLFRAVQFVADCRTGVDRKELKRDFEDLQEVLSQVIDPLSVFSPEWKRNVSKDKVVDELRLLLEGRF